MTIIYDYEFMNDLTKPRENGDIYLSSPILFMSGIMGLTKVVKIV